METKTALPLGTFLWSARHGKQNRPPADRLAKLQGRFVAATQRASPPRCGVLKNPDLWGEGFKFAWKWRAASVLCVKSVALAARLARHQYGIIIPPGSQELKRHSDKAY
ncbi:hypothetical protein TraAM80_10258, partial [Trypanosoma rangeli]